MTLQDFIKLYKNANGREVLNKVIHEHMLFPVVCSLLANGASRKGLEITRLTIELKTQDRLRKKHLSNIDELADKIDASYKCDYRGSKDVWVLWLQGEDAAPAVVKECINSHRKYLEGRTYNLLTEKNYREYVDFPHYIEEKIGTGAITKTHFSDLLRLELLNRYGGTWIDATVLLTGKPVDYMLESPLFAFQTLKPGLDGHTTSISSWFMTCQESSRILMLTRDLLWDYWRTHDKLIDYFLLHHCFQAAIEKYAAEWERVIPVSNETPHILMLNEEKMGDEKWLQSVLQQTNVHKMTYKKKCR